MNRFLFLCLFATLSFGQTNPDPAATGNRAVAGNWMGTLDAGVSRLRLGVRISVAATGELTATLDSLDQNASGIPIRSTIFEDRKLHLDIAALEARFDGTLSPDGMEINGTFQQGAVRRLILKRVDRIELPPRPQQPQPPFPYSAEEVSYQSGEITLVGTLTLPAGAGPFPAALLISGSGPQDRDETMAGHKPFAVIADELTRRGIAVLRMDDRGAGRSGGRSTAQTFDSMAGDVLAGVEYLQTRPEVDARRIGLIGHSEGGIVGPIAAVRSPHVAYLVLLAGTGVSGEELLYSQADLVARSAGAPEASIQLNHAIQVMSFQIVKSESDPKIAAGKMMAEWQKMKAELPPERQAMLNAAAIDAALARQFAEANSPELRDIVLSNPAETLRRVTVPVLALNGERDIQVLAGPNLTAIAEALRAGGNLDVTTVSLPGLNHLFQNCVRCTISEYGELDETFSPEALRIIGDWIVDHTRAR